MEIKMRMIRKTDIDYLMDISNSVIGDNPMNLNINKNTSEDIIKKISRHSKHYPIYIGECKDGPICWLSFKPFSSEYPFDNVAVFEICIDKAHKYDGLEKSLISFAEQQADILGYTKIITYIVSGNVPFANFFISSGYREVGVLKKHGYYKGKLIDFVMLEKIINTRIDNVNKYYRENYDFYNNYFTDKENSETERLEKAGMLRSEKDPHKWYFPMEENS